MHDTPDELIAVTKFMESCNCYVSSWKVSSFFARAYCHIRYGHGMTSIMFYIVIGSGTLSLRCAKAQIRNAEYFRCELANPSCFDKLGEALAEL